MLGDLCSSIKPHWIKRSPRHGPEEVVGLEDHRCHSQADRRAVIAARIWFSRRSPVAKTMTPT